MMRLGTKEPTTRAAADATATVSPKKRIPDRSKDLFEAGTIQQITRDRKTGKEARGPVERAMAFAVDSPTGRFEADGRRTRAGLGLDEAIKRRSKGGR